MTEVATAHELAEIVIRAQAKGVVENPDPAKGCRSSRAGRRFYPLRGGRSRAGRVAWCPGQLRVHPGMDARKWMPGQNWSRAVEAAIETSDFFLACFSTRQWPNAAVFKRRSATRPVARAKYRSMKGAGAPRLLPRAARGRART